jgi:hypothetical protein
MAGSRQAYSQPRRALIKVILPQQIAARRENRLGL